MHVVLGLVFAIGMYLLLIVGGAAALQGCFEINTDLNAVLREPVHVERFVGAKKQCVVQDVAYNLVSCFCVIRFPFGILGWAALSQQLLNTIAL